MNPTICNDLRTLWELSLPWTRRATKPPASQFPRITVSTPPASQFQRITVSTPQTLSPIPQLRNFPQRHPRPSFETLPPVPICPILFCSPSCPKENPLQPHAQRTAAPWLPPTQRRLLRPHLLPDAPAQASHPCPRLLAASTRPPKTYFPHRPRRARPRLLPAPPPTRPPKPITRAAPTPQPTPTTPAQAYCPRRPDAPAQAYCPLRPARPSLRPAAAASSPAAAATMRRQRPRRRLRP